MLPVEVLATGLIKIFDQCKVCLFAWSYLFDGLV